MKPRLYEDEDQEHKPDPDETPVKDRKLFTQPYDLNISSLVSQIRDKTLYLRPLSNRPHFQRKYVWTNRLASLLIESILLNIPIPPCYFSQNQNFELDVIDGQQRIFSIFRFMENQFSLTSLEVISEINGKHFYELDAKLQKKIETHTLRSVIITNDSHPKIQFDVFERLNSHTVPLNAQEIRNCMYRGNLNDLLGELAEYKPWLDILGKRTPDKRLRDEELILRFFAFHINGLSSYRTPQKHWLNDLADTGRRYSDSKISELRNEWKHAIDKCLIIFPPSDCFRRIEPSGGRRVINRALMDLMMSTVAEKSIEQVRSKANDFRQYYYCLLRDEKFTDLISRSIDHKSRTSQRFEIWNDRLKRRLF